MFVERRKEWKDLDGALCLPAIRILRRHVMSLSLVLLTCKVTVMLSPLSLNLKPFIHHLLVPALNTICALLSSVTSFQTSICFFPSFFSEEFTFCKFPEYAKLFVHPAQPPRTHHLYSCWFLWMPGAAPASPGLSFSSNSNYSEGPWLIPSLE